MTSIGVHVQDKMGKGEKINNWRQRKEKRQITRQERRGLENEKRCKKRMERKEGKGKKFQQEMRRKMAAMCMQPSEVFSL